MLFRLPVVSALALTSALLGMSGTSWAQASAPPEHEVLQHLTQSCGGFPGTPCPEGQLCIDDPSDDCDPDNGGADCIGICVMKSQCEAASCDDDDPRRLYVNRSPAQCSAIRFVCQQGEQAFVDACGCGCERGQ